MRHGVALAVALAGLAATATQAQHRTSGVLPDASVLLISEADGQAQMGVQNRDTQPLLLYTRVYDVNDDAALKVVALPSISRLDPQGRQVIRFVLERPDTPLTAQHYKRVTFEGIPPKAGGGDRSRVQVNIRYDLPVVVTPRGLPPDDAPWTHLVVTTEGSLLVVRNPSAYVVRLSRDVLLLPSNQPMELLSRTFFMPGEILKRPLPADVDPAALTAVRLHPATLYGFAAADHDAAVSH